MKHSVCTQKHGSPRSARPGADKNKSTQGPSRRRVTHSLGELGRQDVRSDVRETREEDFVPWQKHAGQFSATPDVSGMYAMGGTGNRGRPINGTCYNCGQLGDAYRCCPPVDEAGNAAMAQRMDQIFTIPTETKSNDFGVFLELISRFEFDFRRRGKFF